VGINDINTYLDMNKKLIRLTESDLHRIIKESIYRIITEIDTNGHSFEEYVDEYGDITISAYNNGQLMGYSILVIHKDIYSLESEISETDSYETAEDVISKLRFGKPIVELADVDVKKEYRGFGVSKMLLEYVLSKYNGYQFYLRVCPTDGVDEKTLANSVGRYGFITVTDTENGTFMVKR
jgi:GNAT superfamily N-acetyltransferase